MAEDASLVGARAAFDSLSKQDFTELMAYKRPPEALANICTAALLAVGMPVEDGWVDVQRGIVSRPEEFRRAVLKLEPSGIDPPRCAALSERLATLENTDMDKISRLGAALKVWLTAVVLPR